MLQSETVLLATNPTSAIARMCKHFSHKVPAQWDANSARIEFPTGNCEMASREESVHLLCRAADAEAMANLQQVITRHIPKLLWRDEQTVTWSPVVASTEAKEASGAGDM